MPDVIAILSMANDELLEVLEGMARQHCHTRSPDADEPNLTDSGALGANCSALELLEKHKRFRIIRGCGRMVCGYWPEHDPGTASPMPPNADLSGRTRSA